MARITLRTTFSLDPETHERLDALAARWAVSRSEALRRIVRTAAAVEEVGGSSEALRALEELQGDLGLSPERAEAWVTRLRQEREAWLEGDAREG